MTGDRQERRLESVHCKAKRASDQTWCALAKLIFWPDGTLIERICDLFRIM